MVVARVAEATQVDLAEAVADWVVVEAKVPAIQTTADRLQPMLLLGKLQPAPGIDVTWLQYSTVLYWSALPDGLNVFIYNLRTIHITGAFFGRTRTQQMSKEIC